MNLAGELPESLKYCHSLQTLDLSGNALSGSVPAQICDWLPYLTTLDLSNNRLSDPIPLEIVNCKFLNSLILNDNRLSSSIPCEVARLDRLKKFSVANNGLSGTIPAELSKFGKDDFDGNSGLCGKPLGSKCRGLTGKSLGIIIAAGVVGAAGSLFLGLGIWWWFFVTGNKKKQSFGGVGEKGESGWVGLLKSHSIGGNGGRCGEWECFDRTAEEEGGEEWECFDRTGRGG